MSWSNRVAMWVWEGVCARVCSVVCVNVCGVGGKGFRVSWHVQVCVVCSVAQP